MNLKKNYLIFAVIIQIFLLGLLMPAAAQQKPITITGVVEGFEFDDDDNVLEVGIVVPTDTDDGIEYTTYSVLKKGKGLKLLELVDETVEVTGNLTVDADGNNTIEVLKFQVVTPPDMEEDMPEIEEDIEQ